MLQVINNLLDAETLRQVQEEVRKGRFVDGRSTAFGTARRVKNNLQLDPAAHAGLHEKLRKSIATHPEFWRLAMPLRMTPLRIARYEPGMEYGYHSDSPTIEGVRTDLSFTLFLSDPGSYDGGELAMATPIGDFQVKLPAGSLVLYGTGQLHRVAPVTRGCREVVVGWVQSEIRDEAQRDVVAELELLRHDYVKRIGHDAFADRLLKCSNNLRRFWIEN